MNKIIVAIAAIAVFVSASFATTTPASAAISSSTHCGVSAQWTGAIVTQYSNGVKLTYWSAAMKNDSRAYCFLAQRKTAPKNTYVNISAHGVGRYGSLSTTNYFVLRGSEKTTVKLSLFKKSGDNATTYWSAPPVGIGG